MTLARRNILFGIGIFLAAVSPIAALLIVLNNSSSQERNFAKDFRQELPRMLEVLNDGAFHRIPIDYKDPVLLKRNIYLTTNLDESEATEVMQKIQYLEQLDPKSPINLFLNTSGGYGGIMLANYLRTVKCKVNTIALDYCASAGCEVLVAGTGKRQAFSSSRIVVHIVVNSDDDRDDLNYSTTKQQEKVNVTFWTKYSKLPEAYYSNRDKDVFYCLTAQEALDFGLIDEVID